MDFKYIFLMIDCILKGKKISAIKAYREGALDAGLPCTLPFCKTAVEKVISHFQEIGVIHSHHLSTDDVDAGKTLDTGIYDIDEMAVEVQNILFKDADYITVTLPRKDAVRLISILSKAL